MTDPVFLVAELPAVGPTVLDGPEGRHAALVRRLGPGETLLLADGVGGRAFCVVVAAERDSLRLDVRSIERVPRSTPTVTVVQALPKGDRGEAAVEMMTEAGVDAVVPWQASRSVTRWKEARGDKALARWRSTAREAAKQARRLWLPEVADPASTADVRKLLASVDAAFVLHEEAVEPLAIIALPSELGSVALVVGPEGGIAPDELEAFVAAGAVPVRLGPTVLRTSTAGVAALAVVNARTGRWT
ncbi:16S rRNA (uracil(1498)-N(3))-methyltransferase [Cryptosporangium aurantiacum]|uniref:Ribosomal RNA small subunit methyltransferase E n=1 Tax=Cryptosporangium aurantiacum TaxID=134849 RepID=A0A1M7Q6D1_9ACTN|nr:16S rRNA (uracil(1498)-N(3))-methyltransferase [Cryptosporangium aurantiacum]SHN25733.1 16S rRNA (uracil1498-N3)-methyltransferase [Cryptosporangium aurantiacum]